MTKKLSFTKKKSDKLKHYSDYSVHYFDCARHHFVHSNWVVFVAEAVHSAAPSSHNPAYSPQSDSHDYIASPNCGAAAVVAASADYSHSHSDRHTDGTG